MKDTNIITKYLEEDNADYAFDSKKELIEYNQFRKENDLWLDLPINQVGAYGISNFPIFIPERVKAPSVKINGFSIPVEPIDTNNVDVQECIQTTGMFLCVPLESGYKALPTDERSLASIYQRCDDFCGVMTRDTAKAGKLVLPVEEKAERVTRDNSLFSLNCKILYRDGKVRFSASNQYTIADNGVLIEALEDVLTQTHPGLEYHSGRVSHEYLVALYDLNDRMMEESLRISLNDMGNDIHELKAGVQFVTSDIGYSAVKANVFLNLDGNIIFLRGVSVNHKEDNLEESFRNGLEKFAEILKESEEKIEEIGNVDVPDIQYLVKMIVDYYPTIFPSKVSDEVLDELPIRYPKGGTGIDVYMALCDIVNRHIKANKLSLARTLDLQEQVAGLIYLSYDKLASGEMTLKK